jgi:hypothetical protein
MKDREDAVDNMQANRRPVVPDRTVAIQAPSQHYCSTRNRPNPTTVFPPVADPPFLELLVVYFLCDNLRCNAVIRVIHRSLANCFGLS